MTVMTHVKALQAGHSSQGTSEPITPGVGYVVVANVRFDVTGQVSSVKGDSVWAGSYLMASGGYMCSGWPLRAPREAN